MAKLTKAQWDTLKKRLDKGEKASDLAREFGITRGAITNRFSVQKRAVKVLAGEIVRHHTSLQSTLKKFTPAIQIEAWDMAGELLTISKHVSGGAKFGAMTFHRLAGIANLHAQKLDDDDPDPEAVLNIARITKVGNDAVAPALNLLAANKDRINKNEDSDKDSFLERVAGKVIGVTHDIDDD